MPGFYSSWADFINRTGVRYLIYHALDITRPVIAETVT